jgi:site-specific DNA-methyltransferase (adenine-specific)
MSKEQSSFWSEDKAYSSRTEEWGTPQDLFDKLNDEFDFTLDPCANDENHKCDKYYTIEDNGLKQDWGGADSFYESTLW